MNVDRKNIILVVIALALGAAIFLFGRGGTSPVLSERNAAPPLPERDTYFVSGNQSGPEIYEASFDPLGSVAEGVEQRVRVKVRYAGFVESVQVTMIMDGGEHPFPLALKEGSAADGVWEGSWTVADTRERVYQAAIEAKGSSAEKTDGGEASRVVLSFQPAF
ncbi:MAG: hypothetical protein HYU81_03190 [Candidatus Brennerbacteria bacterium]|nr:hypothetical protein [Candidatus Brennerbacteria bacterium]